MALSLPTADWSLLGRDSYFRKFEIYQMGWSGQVTLDNFVVAAAPYGGPIALVRDDRKIVKVQGGVTGKPIVFIFSASGMKIASIKWSSGQIVRLGWSASEDLLCVQDDGTVLVYDIFGKHQHMFGMGEEAKDTKIIDAKIFNSYNGTGIAVLTSTYRIILVNSIKQPKLRTMPKIHGMTLPPRCWAIISEERQTRVLVARDSELFFLDQSEHEPQPVFPHFEMAKNGIAEIAVSSNNRHVALLSDTGVLWMGSADLRKKYREFDTGHSTRPKQLEWCGTEAVIGYWDADLMVVGREGDSIQYPYETTVHLVPEIDSVRVIGNYNQDVIQKVPPLVQQVFHIGSTEPGSYLLEASKHFQKGSHRADEYIRLVKERLEDGVKQCIGAAGFEFLPQTQKMLMRAAQLGKSFIPDLDPDPYVNTCQDLRVLNAVRDFRVGMPLTYVQYKELTLPVLLDRLVLRRQYFLAVQIAKYLRVQDEQGVNRILAHWACYKVKQTQLDDEQLARNIADKLGNNPGVSYSEIAKKAFESGRKRLAIRLIDYEPRASLQVPLLLQLEENQSALLKAIESGDTDLVYMVLLKLPGSMPLGNFQMIIRNYPVAQALYTKYCREHKRDALRDIFVQEDDFAAQAALFIRESYETKRIESRLASQLSAQDNYKKGRLEQKAVLCGEQHKLLVRQRQLETKFEREFVNLSLHDTVRQLLMMQEVKLADSLRAEYRLPDRRYWWLRILTLGELGDWKELENFSKAKKSPIGYEPFVDVCLQYDRLYEAKKYLQRVKDELKVKYYVKVGSLAEAADIAFEQKDRQALDYVQWKNASSDRPLDEKINNYKSQLSGKK